ncbi:PREDICTED: uncharacterized protein LOC109181208 [Ipomoea nil]|uniref:uncharacterized protein LOC109181208 n=1 Tax=Ipomoea nil TaxID=35883 RepID=UPI0009009621|nr:PREDICTED: uncharacterized protein LOC109181208 [Ipomoea nil]
MSYTPDASPRATSAPEQAAERDNASSSSGSSSSSSSGSGSTSEEEEERATSSGRGSPTEGVRETPTRVVGDHTEAAPRGGDRENTPEQTEEDPAGPATPAVELEFLNSESVEQEMSLLTKGKAARIAGTLRGRAEFDTSRQLGNADHHKKTAARRLKEIKELQAELEKTQKALKKGDEERVLAEKVASRAIGEARELKAQLENPSELVRAAFKDKEVGTAFLTAARGDEVGNELIVSFGKWAFTAGKQKMLERIRKRLEEALDADDLQLVLSALPSDVADPGPSPFTPTPKAKVPESGASSAAAPSGKEATAGAQEAKK